MVQQRNWQQHHSAALSEGNYVETISSEYALRKVRGVTFDSIVRRRWRTPQGLPRRHASCAIAGIAQADLLARQVQGFHDLDALLVAHERAGRPAADRRFQRQRLVLHAAALNGRLVALDAGILVVVDVERGRAVPDVVDFDAPLRAMDHRAVAAALVQRRGADRQRAAAVLHGQADFGIDAGGAHARHRRQRRGRAQQIEGKGHRVDAQVQQGAARQGQGIDAMRRFPGQLLHVGGMHRGDTADGAIGDQLADARHVREEARPHRLHHHALVDGGQSHHAAGLGGVHGEGLFQQHMLAGHQRRARLRRVEGVGRGDVDHIHLGVGQQLGVRAIGLGHAQPGGQCACAFAASRTHRGDVQPRQLDIRGELLGDPAGGQDSPLQMLAQARRPGRLQGGR